MTNTTPSAKVNLSVVIPIRGMAGKLENLRQTLSGLKSLPIQIILVHDDSLDGTQEEIEELLKMQANARISLLRVLVESPGLARNAGLAMTNAEWICFWDSDDLPNPSQYLDLLEEMTLHEALVGIGQICSLDKVSEIKKPHYVDSTRDDFVYQLANIPAFTRMIFHQSVISSNRFNNLRSGEDQCFLRDLNFLNYKYFVSNEIIYSYVTSDSEQLTQNVIALEDTEIALDYLVESFSKTNGKMKEFAFAQIIKIFLGVIKSRFSRNKHTLFSLRIVKWSSIALRSPFSAAKLFFYFYKNRIQLAGRR